MDKYTIAPPSGSTNNSVGAADRKWKEGHFEKLPNWQEYLAESTGYGIVSGCEPTISGLTVTVGAGVVHLADGTRKEIAETSVTLDSADPTNPRIDLVYITSAGEVAKVTGTAAASPSTPVLPSNGIKVCVVTVAANASTGTVNRVQTIAPNLTNYGVVNVKDYGAKGDGTTDDTAAIQYVFNHFYNRRKILFPKGTYKLTSSLIMHPNSKQMYIAGDDSTILHFTGGGDGIVFEQNDPELGQCVFENLMIEGTNPPYSALSDLTNTGAGIKLVKTYNNKFINCYVSGFKYGLYLNIGIGNIFECGTYFRFNEYGVYITGGASNLNRFINCNIRENRRHGVHIEHDGSQNHILSNLFNMCYIESNVPYNSDDRTLENVGIGVYLKGAQVHIFDSCYFEYNIWSIVFDTTSQNNKIINSYFTNNPNWRLFKFSGTTVKNNIIENCTQGSNVSIGSIETTTDYTELYTNVIRNCFGLNINNSVFYSSVRSAIPTFYGNAPNPVGAGDAYDFLKIKAIYQNPGSAESQRVPWIEGNGTTSAVLHTNGKGLIQLGSLITADTSIVKIDGMTRGDILIITNYQNAHSVTFKAGSTTSADKLSMVKGDATLRTHGDNIVFCCDYTYNVTELSRSIASV